MHEDASPSQRTETVEVLGEPASGRVDRESTFGKRRRAATPLEVITAGCVILLALSAVIDPSFFSRSFIVTLTPLLGVLILVSCGQALVIGTGGIDLSVPATMTFVGSIILKASSGANSGLFSALIWCLVLCLIIGIVNGLLVETFALSALVVTLATGQLIEGVDLVYRGQLLAFTSVPPALSNWAGGSISGVSYILLVALGVVVVGTIVIRGTVFGRRLSEASAGREAARLSGTAPRSIRVVAWIGATVLYGAGAVLLSGQLGSPDLTLGSPYQLASIVPVVLGGAILTGARPDFVTTALGALFISVLDYDLAVQGYSAGVQETIQGLVLALGLAAVYVLQRTRLVEYLRRLFTPRRSADRAQSLRY
jgi:ribose transport system permease protein